MQKKARYEKEYLDHVKMSSPNSQLPWGKISHLNRHDKKKPKAIRIDLFLHLSFQAAIVYVWWIAQGGWIS